MPKQLTVKVVSAADQAKESKLLIRPNPGDMIMALIFGWALLCFFLVTIGESLLRRLAGLAKNTEYRDLLLESDQALAAVMIGGSIALILAVLLCHKFPKAALISMPVSFSFASASWVPLHDVTFPLKYLVLTYLGVFAAFYVYKNFWRILATPYVRLLFALTVWIAAVCVWLGGQLEDFWYVGIVVCMVMGFAVFFVYEYNNRAGLEDFFNALSWGAVLTVAIHWTAPLFAEEFINQGRFQSYFGRATGFSVTLLPLVLILFWRAMADKDAQRSMFFSFMALASMALLLWSGSRSPIAAGLLGGALLWLRFRSRLFLVIFFLGVLGLAVQLLFNIDENIETQQIQERLANADTGRLELWQAYLEVALKSPIYGYAASRLGFVLAGDDLGGYFSGLGATEIEYESVHNAYLALLMRFGGVSLILFLVLLGFALRRAVQVLFDNSVPEQEKSVFILPAVLIPTICFTQIFEDSVFGTGKGVVEGFILLASMFICQVYGTKLLEFYNYTDAKGREDDSMAGLLIDAQREQAAP